MVGVLHGVIGATASPFPAPPNTGWTQLNFGSATVTQNGGTRTFTMPDINADWSASIEHRPLSPTRNYTLTARITTALNLGNRSVAGLVLRQSSDGKLVVFGFEVFGTPTADAGNRIIARALASEATGNTSPANTYYRGAATATVTSNIVSFASTWLRIVDDGTNRIYRVSSDGIIWSTLFQHGRTTYVTADQAGWFRMNNSDLGSDAATLTNWWLQ